MIQSPYRRGADDGFYFGLYLAAMFFASFFAGALPLLSIISLLMGAAVPLVIYRFMRSYERSLDGYATFSMLWMQGVVIFLCGMLVAGFMLVVYMKWIEPDFVLEQLRSLAALEGEMPGTAIDTAAGMASDMLKANFIPSGIAIVTEMIMLSIVSGSILSIVLSAIISTRRSRVRKLFKN